jgi:FKBP-type peptidyl-prolyl cis-trans isomerase FkpA
MKRVFLAVTLSTILFMSCGKKDQVCTYNDSSVTAPASETANVKTYLDANGITATLHPSGFYYKITQAGTGAAVVNLCSNVTVTYVGKLTNGTVFDPAPASGLSFSSATFQLGQVIVGWQKGVPLISTVGKITLYIPPSLGYGANDVKNQQGVVVIPGNSILIFNIELVSVS